MATFVQRRKTNRLPTHRQDHVVAYSLTIPPLILMVIFVFIPLFMSVSKSFTTWSTSDPGQYVGLDNFKTILKDTYFTKTLLNIGAFIILIIPVQFTGCFLFAHVLRGMLQRISAFVKTAIYVPGVVSGVVASLIALYIFNYQGGLVNYTLIMLGFKRIAFFNDPWAARIIIAIVSMWLGSGHTSLVMYAGLMNIPDVYYEAAEIDGANGWVKLTRITIPSMKNIFVLLFVGMFGGTIQAFDLQYLMTGGGPLYSTATPMMYIIGKFRDPLFSLGYTMAAAVLIMIILSVLTSVVFFLVRAEKSMD